MTLLIARGTLDDVPETDGLIRETADWLITKGEPLWGPNETSLEELGRVTRAGELIVGRVEGELATCMYLHDEDRLFWPQVVARRGVLHSPPRGRAEIRRPRLRPCHARMGGERGARQGPAVSCGSTASRARSCSRSIASAGYSRVDPAPIQVGEHFVVRHEKRV